MATPSPAAKLASFIARFDPEVDRLIRRAGRRAPIVKSISAKQRPRRATR